MNLTGTYARHSFATNLHAAKVPMEYISDAMGHSLGNRGQITIRYISPYTIEERAKNIQDNRETANKAVREWKSHHQQTYNDFKRQVAAIGSGDLSLMERTMGLLDDCMPQNARDFYAYIFKYIMNPDSVADGRSSP